ncbi:MAG: glycosyltransferase [Pseudolabrys sp.]
MPDKPHIVIVAKGSAAWLGGRQYTLNLLRALIAYRAGLDSYDVSVLFRGRDEAVSYEPLRPALRVCAEIETVLQDYTLATRVRWKFKRTFQGWINPRLDEPLLRLGTTFAYPISSATVPSADWIPDFQYLHYPDRTSAADIAARKLEFSNVVRHARRIVLSSENAECDCHAVFPQSVGHTTVLRFRVFAEPEWLAADPITTIRKYNLPGKFALVSNWFVPTKNHIFILDALAAVREAERQSMHVVFTGDIYDYRNPGFYNVFLNRIHTLGLQKQVSILGVIPKHDQIQLLRAATGYLQPSLFEGWNTGVEEAHLFGKRILLSDIPVHREQAPARATYFDPRNAGDLAGKLMEIFSAANPAENRAEIEQASFAHYSTLQREFARSFLDICGVHPPMLEPKPITLSHNVQTAMRYLILGRCTNDA